LSGASSVDVATLNTAGTAPATNVDFNLIVVC
jgi:hypothetical protein